MNLSGEHGGHMRLVAPVWSGVTSQDFVVHQPSAADIEGAVQALNGQSRNDVYVTADDDPDWGQDEQPWLGVCGGPDVFHVTYNVTARDEFYTAVQQGAGDDAVEIVCGGQTSAFARYQLVGFDVAVAVAMAFATTGERLDTVDWERRG